jgi:hypothetical protein
VLSEVDIPAVIIPQLGHGPNQRGFTTSLVADGLHYLLDSRGREELYDLAADPRELHDLKNDPGQNPVLGRFRNSLDVILSDSRVTGTLGAVYRKHLRKVLESLSRRPPIRDPRRRRPPSSPLGSRFFVSPAPTAFRSGGEGRRLLEAPSSQADCSMALHLNPGFAAG